MKFKIGLIFLIVIIVAVSIFVFQNSTEVPLTFYPGSTLHLPLSIVIICSIILGILLMFVLLIGFEVKLRLKNRKIQKVLNKKEKSIEILKKALLNLFKGKIKEAKKEFYNAYKTDDNNFISLIFLKDIEEKDKTFDNLNKLPEELKKYALLDYYYETKQFENIIKIADDILNDSDFKNIELLEKIKNAYINLKNFDKAIEIQNRINKISKSKSDSPEIYYLKAKETKNIKDIEDLIKKFPKFSGGYYLKYEIENNISALKDGYKKTLDVGFIYELMKLYLKDKENKELEKLILKLNSNDEAKIFHSILHFLKGNLDEAKKIATNLFQQDKFKPLAAIILAETSYKTEGELKDSTEYFKKAFNLEKLNFAKYICKNCKSEFDNWIDYCENCKSFDSIKLKIKIC